MRNSDIVAVDLAIGCRSGNESDNSQRLSRSDLVIHIELGRSFRHAPIHGTPQGDALMKRIVFSVLASIIVAGTLVGAQNAPA